METSLFCLLRLTRDIIRFSFFVARPAIWKTLFLFYLPGTFEKSPLMCRLIEKKTLLICRSGLARPVGKTISHLSARARADLYTGFSVIYLIMHINLPNDKFLSFKKLFNMTLFNKWYRLPCNLFNNTHKLLNDKILSLKELFNITFSKKWYRLLCSLLNNTHCMK